jgi:hypothetical protein
MVFRNVGPFSATVVFCQAEQTENFAGFFNHSTGGANIVGLDDD